MKKFFLTVLMIFCFAFEALAVQYEYKLVPLGSLGGLQKSKESAAKTAKIEALLNEQGQDGWEIAEIFAVRTTFDPNVFFVIMKREK